VNSNVEHDRSVSGTLRDELDRIRGIAERLLDLDTE